MNWFERLTGFVEEGYEDTRSRLEVDGDRLRSRVNGRSYGIGTLELTSLAILRQRARDQPLPPGRLRVRLLSGDARRLHRRPEFNGALFQVASQFNLLEMVGPDVTPEHGVARYEFDRTQGPACAMAAGAATIYRNYFAPVGHRSGQTSHQQLDGLAAVGGTLATLLGKPVAALWTMQNGYAMCTRSGLDAISQWLESATPEAIDTLRSQLHIGIHRDVEVTDADEVPAPVVSQAFCSALPVAYGSIPARHWRGFASLVLEAAYEATLWEGVANRLRGRSNTVLLTLLGSGAFGNDANWILSALRRALRLTAEVDLDVRIVSYDAPAPGVIQLAEEFA
jgi:hypothetical protein